MNTTERTAQQILADAYQAHLTDRDRTKRVSGSLRRFVMMFAASFFGIWSAILVLTYVTHGWPLPANPNNNSVSSSPESSGSKVPYVVPLEYFSETREDISGLKQFLPDPKLTPGKFDPNVNEDMIRVHGYSLTIRDVTDAMRKEVFSRYRIPWSHHTEYEVDHLIPLSIGGTNDIENLWPQPYAGLWGARVKDHLERELLREVRADTFSLRRAQLQIAQDWIAQYHRTVGDSPIEAHIADDEQ